MRIVRERLPYERDRIGKKETFKLRVWINMSLKIAGPLLGKGRVRVGDKLSKLISQRSFRMSRHYRHGNHYD